MRRPKGVGYVTRVARRSKEERHRVGTSQDNRRAICIYKRKLSSESNVGLWSFYDLGHEDLYGALKALRSLVLVGTRVGVDLGFR